MNYFAKIINFNDKGETLMEAPLQMHTYVDDELHGNGIEIELPDATNGTSCTILVDMGDLAKMLGELALRKF